MKRKTLSLIVGFALVLPSAVAATITVTGPTTVCPGVQYSYTASATNTFGSQDGCFQFVFRINGVDVGYAGGTTCPCYRQSSTYTANFTWPSTGNLQVYVRFIAKQDPTCAYSYGSLTGLVRVVVPERIFDTNGGLSFCSSGQTRTVSVPAVPYNSSNYCNWHHAYDWIVPSGWSIVPANGDPYTVIAGGIRTHATSVNVTSPSSNLASGFTGNYFITVRTEPAWPYPKEISRQIWIGPYGTSLTISGTSQVCPGNLYTFTATPPGGHQPPGHSYNWTYPSGWQLQSPANNNYVTLYVPQYSPNYGPVQVTVNNGCGTSQNGITTYPGYNCGGSGGSQLSIYPNPVDKELVVETNDLNEENDHPPIIQNVRLITLEGEIVRSSDESGKQIKLDVGGLRKGQYFIHVQIGGQTIKEQVVIN